MNIAIIGKNSFIGKNIINNLHDYTFTEFDLLNKRPDNIDLVAYNTVIHLAAIVHQTKTISEKDYFRINSDLAYNTARHAKQSGCQHFVFFSTIKVYGESTYNEEIYSETSECNPVDSYGKSKLEAEEKILALNNNNFRVSIIRPSMVYGKGVKANMHLLIRLIRLLPVVPLGGIDNKRAMVSIDNLLITLKAIIDQKASGIFLACDEKTISTSELCKLLLAVTNPSKKLIKLPGWIINILKTIFPGKMKRIYGSFNVDASLTHNNLGIKNKLITPKITLEKML